MKKTTSTLYFFRNLRLKEKQAKRERKTIVNKYML